MNIDQLQNNGTKNTMKLGALTTCLFMFLGLFIFNPSLTLVLIIGMMPTFGARLSDPTSNKAQTYCVGFCNLASIFPSLYEIYTDKFNMDAAYSIIHNQYNLLIILSGSALGWVLFFIIPSINVSVLRTRDKKNLIAMIKRYDELKKIWGDSIPDSEIISTINAGKLKKETPH